MKEKLFLGFEEEKITLNVREQQTGKYILGISQMFSTILQNCHVFALIYKEIGSSISLLKGRFFESVHSSINNSDILKLS